MGNGAVSVQDVLVVNVGSSSVKLRVLDGENAVIAERDLPAGDDATLAEAIAGFGETPLVGHRIVHGGSRYPHRSASTTRCAPHSVSSWRLRRSISRQHLRRRIARSALPRARHVACFDTAFHATLPAAAVTYASPRWRAIWGFAATAFTDSRTPTPRAAAPPWSIASSRPRGS